VSSQFPAVIGLPQESLRRGYDIAETTAAHTNGNHRYRVSRTVIGADVFINLPKLKTHKKAGITCSLKNLVGINTYKNFLPHYTEGTPAMGGDQFPQDDLRSVSEVFLLERFKRIVRRHQKHGRAFIPLKKSARCFSEKQHTRSEVATGMGTTRCGARSST
jgi:hypothetical protein